MLHDIVTKGATDRSVTVRIIDSADGTPETGVVFNTSGIDLWYRREGAARVALTEATLAALTTAHTDGGFLHVSDGVYRLDLPDAAFATGANYVDFGGTVTGMVVIGGRVRLVDYSLEDGVRMGLTALPNAAADAAGGLPISDAGGLDMDSIKTDTAAILVDTGTTLQAEIDGIQADTEDIQARLPAALVGGRIDANVGAISGDVTAADNLETAFDDTAGPVPWAGILDQGTAQAATGTTLQLRAAATFADDAIIGAVLMVHGSTQGYWQVRQITDYVSSTDTATVDAWQVTPSGTITYKVLAAPPAPATPVSVNVTQISGDSTAADNLEAALDGTGFNVGGGAIVAASVTGTVGSVTGNVGGNVAGSVGTVNALANNSVTAASLAADAGTEIGAAVWATATRELTSGTNIVLAKGTGVTGFNDLSAAAVNAEVDTAIADAALATQASVNDLPTNAELATALGTADDAVLAAIATVDTVVDAIKVTTDKLDDTLQDGGSDGFVFSAVSLELAPTSGPSAAAIADAVWEEAIADHSGTAGSTAEALNAAGSAGDPWVTALPGAYGAGSAGFIIGTNLNATVSSRASQASVDDLPTNAELATALGTADDAVLAAIATVDTVVDAIKVTTDKLDDTLQDGGSDGYVFSAVSLELAPTGLTAAGVRAAVGLASANLDTQLDALPTNAELAASLAPIEADTQDIQSRLPAALVSGRIDASVGAMAANVMTAAAAAADLTTELQSGLATAAALATVDTVVDAIQAKTDALPSDPADQSLIIAATDSIMGRLGAPAGASMSADVAAVKADTAAILLDTGTDGVVVAAASKTGYRLSAAGVDDIHDEAVDGATTMRESMRLHNAVLGGKASGLETTEATYRDLADTKDRVVATVDVDGNRSAVTRDLT